MELTAIGPERACPCHQHAVVGGGAEGADVAIGIRHCATVGDDHAVVAEEQTNIDFFAVRPERVRPGHQHAVVGGGVVGADVAIDTRHSAAVGNDHAVVAEGQTNKDVLAVRPERVRPGHQHAVVGGGVVGGVVGADVAVGIRHCTSVGHREAVAAAFVADIEVS